MQLQGMNAVCHAVVRVGAWDSLVMASVDPLYDCMIQARSAGCYSAKKRQSVSKSRCAQE